LQVDGRRPYADIAAELGLAPSTVQQRASRLIDTGLLKIRAVTDPMAMGVTVIAEIAIKVEGMKIREVAEAIANFEEVNYVVICAGAYDVLTEVACEDNDSLIDFISNKLARVDGVRSSEIHMYLQIVKNTYQWGLP
jgi:Lrp/AsnC family transcriptional regulator for asnA, asnC and gidA